MNKKYFVQVFGCQMNFSDAERISAIMEDIGYAKGESQESADVILFVSCSVRQTAEDRVFGLKRVFDELKSKNPKLQVVLTGCMAKREYRAEPDLKKRQSRIEKYNASLKEKLPWVDYIISIDEIPVLYEIFGDKDVNLEHYLSVAPEYDSKFVAYVPISTGCNNFCSYCIVPFTRGAEKSRPFKEVIHEVEELIHKGYKEINLLGQNVNSYGNDLGEENLFPKLLAEIDKIEGDYWIRFVSCHPKDVSDELIDVLANSKHVVPQVHFALQSGNNEMLKKMNRPYTREKYLEIVEKFKKRIHNIALTTDVIVGFPGETDEQFLDTKTIMEEVGFTMVYMNKYSPRKGTKSAELKNDISWKEKGKRRDILNDVLTKTSAKFNEQFLNKEIKVLVTDEKNGKFFGHSAQGIDVKISPPLLRKGVPLVGRCGVVQKEKMNDLVGQFADVKVTETGSWGIKGNLI